MTVDPFDNLRHARDEALSAVDGASVADGYERAAIAMAWSRLTGERSTARLTVTAEGKNHFGVGAAADLERAIQNAATMMATARRTNRWDIRSSHSAWAESTALVPGVAGNRLTFEVPPALQTPGGDGDTTWIELGLVDLFETLPQDDTDTDAVLGILSSPTTIRSAVLGLVRPKLDATLTFELERVGTRDPVNAILAAPQRDELRDELQKEFESLSRTTVRGYLDGARMHRRMFFLEIKGQPDIIGSVQPSMSERVLALVGKDVVAELDVSRTVKKSGSPGRPRFNLASVRPAEDDLLPEG